MDAGFAQDGFKALVMLSKRYDAKTSASLLQAFLDVVKPPSIKNTQDLVSGVNKWEVKVTALKSRYAKDLDSEMRLAILIGMLPKEHQDMIMQTGCMTDKMTYEGIRDRVMNIANQRMQMSHPTPMDAGAVQGEGIGEDEWYEDEWQDVDAVGANTQCYTCGGFGHMSRQCPKGKGGYGKGDQKGKGYAKGQYWKGGGNWKGGKGYGKENGKGFANRGSCRRRSRP